MSDSEKLILFPDLTNFQKWVIFYIKEKGYMNPNVINEINNFCDKTKKDIDLDNYEENMNALQKELDYFIQVELLEESQLDRTDNNKKVIHPAGSLIFTKKGDLYCYQQLDDKLDKINTKKIINAIKSSDMYVKSSHLCDTIISKVHSNLSYYIIYDKRTTMEKIIVLGEILKLINSSN